MLATHPVEKHISSDARESSEREIKQFHMISVNTFNSLLSLIVHVNVFKSCQKML